MSSAGRGSLKRKEEAMRRQNPYFFEQPEDVEQRGKNEELEGSRDVGEERLIR